MGALVKRAAYRNPKILSAAKGEECTMNSPWCNYNPETVVFCHLNESWAGKGKSLKADDVAGFYGCNGPRSCHAWYDSEQATEQERTWYAFRAMYRTLRRLLDRGILR